MKKLFSILIIFMLSMSIQGCSNSSKLSERENEVTNQSNDSIVTSAAISTQNTVDISNPGTTETTNSDNEKEVDYFSSGSYEFDKNLEGFNLNVRSEELSRQINSVNLPDKFSKNLRYKSLVDEFGTTGLNISIILDDTNNVLAILSTDKRASNKMSITRAVTLKKEFPVRNLNVVYGYIKNGIENIIFTDQRNAVYVVDNSTFNVTRKEKMGSWRTMSAHPFKKKPAEDEWDNMYLYQVSDNNNIRKYDLLTGTSAYDRDLSKLPIKGKILKAEYCIANNSLVVLTESSNNYAFYIIGDEISPLYDIKFEDLPIRIKEKYDDGTSFDKINDFSLVTIEDSGHPKYYISVHQKDTNEDIKLIDLFDGWTEVKK